MKDAKGHGSDGRGGGSNYARQAPTKNGRARMYGSSMADRIKVAQDQQNIKEGRAAGSPGNPLGDAGTADSVRRSFQSLYGNTGGSMASRAAGSPGNPLGDAGTADSVRRSFQSLYGNTGGSMASRDRGAASALASGPKSAPVPVHDSMTSNSTHNDQGHAWGSPEALKDFSNR